MEAPTSSHRFFFFRSIIFKNILLFLLILLVAVVPLAWRYYQDSRDYEIQNLASKLEFFAERGASWIDVSPIPGLLRPADMQTPAYRRLAQTLHRIEQEFNVDNAIIMRRGANAQYTYVAVADVAVADRMSDAPRADHRASGNPCSPVGQGVRNPCNPGTTPAAAVKNPCAPPETVQNPCNPGPAPTAAVKNPCAPREGIFDIGKPVHIHPDFPAAYKATNDTWEAGQMMHSQLVGGKVGNRTFDQFLQINTPLKLNGQVVGILMLNKFANPVADAVRAKTLKVFGLTVGIVALGLALFGYVSARMLRPLKNLTGSANEVAQGNLDIAISPPRSQDEVGRLTATFGTMLEGLRQRDFIRDTFGRYLSQEVVAELLESPDGLRLGGELREVTILVSDLRGFTSMAEHLPPQEVVDFLNRYLERMVDIITRYNGTVDEFQGDGILAFFGAPLVGENDPERAIACAIEMQTAVHQLNAERRHVQLPELAMGIGINTGEVIVGNIGSEKRTKYGAVGSAINAAYRIESYTVGGQILISPSTYERVDVPLRVRDTLAVQFKGIERPITVYDITGMEGQYASTLPESKPDTFTSLATPLPITCYVVEGKTVSQDAIPGALTRLGATAAEATLHHQVALHDNLKVVINGPEALDLPDLYAKVLPSEPSRVAASETSVRLGFTTLPEAARTFLQQHLATSA